MKHLLQLPVFRRLLGGWAIGNLADSALYLTLAIWAKDLTDSSAAAGLVFFALGVPILATPLLGMLADRWHRKPLLVTANLIAAGAALSLMLVEDASMLWLLYAVTVIYGALGMINSSALSGLLRDMLGDDELDSANALLSTVDQGLRIVTPAICAGLYVLWGGQALGIGVAALLVVTAVVLATVQVVETAPEASENSFWREAIAGFAHLRTMPVLWRIVLVCAVAFGVVGFFDTVFFEVVEHGLGMPTAFFGVLMSVQGAGAILGGLTSARVLRAWGPQRMVGTSLGLLAMAALVAAADVLGPLLLPAVVVVIFAAGLGIPWMVVALVTTRQRHTPPRLQGRAAAATNLALNVPQVISTAAGAALVTMLDYRLLLLAAFGVLGCCAVVLLRASWRVTDDLVVIPDRTVRR